MRCREPGPRAPVAIHAACGPGRYIGSLGSNPLAAILRAYKLTIGVLGAFLTIVAASVSASYLAFVLFPILFIVGGIVFMQASSPTFHPLLIGVLGASALAITTAFYMSNGCNWNQRGMC